MKIMIIGSGGREHTLAWKLAQEESVSSIFVAPGNAGTALLPKSQNIDCGDISSLATFAHDNNIDLTLVGSEELLAEGIVDLFNYKGLAILGPNQVTAQLESSKAFAKQFMLKHGIKTAAYHEFTEHTQALKHLDNIPYPTVIKADGLAAGKGVIIAQNKLEAEQAINDIMHNKVFGQAGNKVIIEAFIVGKEASILSFCDGKTIVPMLSAKDHKKIGEGETGLNTGGMGVVCPNPYVTKDIYQSFIDGILQPTLTGLQKDKLTFCGVIFFGLMINDDGVYLLEYNMRMGDPETQAIIPLLDSSLLTLIQDCLTKNLANSKIKWKSQSSCCIVASSKGYPQDYAKGFTITGTEKLNNSQCFIAGASLKDEQLLTSGGRVLNIVACGDNLATAINLAYEDIKQIQFEGINYRKDIGA